MNKREICRQLAAKNPSLRMSDLSRLLVEKHPMLFFNPEHARGILKCALRGRPSELDQPNRAAGDDQSREQTVTVRSLDIRTLEDALRAAKVDLGTWEVERWLVNNWEATMGPKGKLAPAQTYTNIQVKVWLKRRKSATAEKAFEAILDRASKTFSNAKTYRLSNSPKDADHMVEVSLVDQHFGMYAWKDETGNDYDLEIAAERYAAGIDDLLQKASGAKIEKVLLPLGNDFFHLNSPDNRTPAGHNQLDVDTRYQKVFEAGCEAVIQAVHRARAVAPVQVVWIPGNHDPQISYHLCRFVAAIFQADKCVTVDTSPKTRKYVRYGKTLLGLTHGDKENHQRLVSLMVTENPSTYGGVLTREWHLGHFHKQKETAFVGADTQGDVIVRVLPSLSGTDAWHFAQGYVGTRKVAEAYLYHKQEGLVGKFWTSAGTRPRKGRNDNCTETVQTARSG